jgi:ubiquitin carboxyl-terminal hydrolase L3
VDDTHHHLTTMPAQPSISAVVPLESNPEVFTQFGRKLGLSPLLSFTDIYSLDDPDLLSFLPRPMQAVILLFPVTTEYESFKDAEPVEKPDMREVVWMKQIVKNACGLYALLHALLNIPAGFIVQQSPAAKFLMALLTDNANQVELVQNIAKEMYSSFSSQGQTEAPAAEDDVELHFVCFVKRNDVIYELDGRRNGPVVLKSDSGEGDILDSSVINERVKKYMSLVEGDNALRFALMGLAPSMD